MRFSRRSPLTHYRRKRFVLLPRSLPLEHAEKKRTTVPRNLAQLPSLPPLRDLCQQTDGAALAPLLEEDRSEVMGIAVRLEQDEKVR